MWPNIKLEFPLFGFAPSVWELLDPLLKLALPKFVIAVGMTHRGPKSLCTRVTVPKTTTDLPRLLSQQLHTGTMKYFSCRQIHQWYITPQHPPSSTHPLSARWTVIVSILWIHRPWCIHFGDYLENVNCLKWKQNSKRHFSIISVTEQNKVNHDEMDSVLMWLWGFMEPG